MVGNTLEHYERLSYMTDLFFIKSSRALNMFNRYPKSVRLLHWHWNPYQNGLIADKLAHTNRQSRHDCICLFILCILLYYWLLPTSNRIQNWFLIRSCTNLLKRDCSTDSFFFAYICVEPNLPLLKLPILKVYETFVVDNPRL